MTTFSELIAETTEAAVQAALQAAGEIVGLDFEGMAPNAVVRAIGRSVVPKVIYDAFGVITKMARGGFLDFAQDGPWLNALGEQMFGTTRIEMTFATTPCTFTNTSGNVYVFINEQVIVQNAVTKKTYKAAAFSLAESGAEGDEVTVDVIAIEGGTASNADAGDISVLVTTFDGVTVTNEAAARATDLEPRAAYIARCRLAAGAISPNGAEDAYRYVALSATREDGTAIGATKVHVLDDDVSGQVTVYVTDGDGNMDAGDVTRIDELITSIVVPHGIDYQGTFEATAVTIPVTYTATALASEGLTEDEIEELVDAALAELFESTVHAPIGGIAGFMYASKIRATIEQVRAEPGSPQPIVDVTLTLPAANVAIADDEVPVLGLVTPTINMI